MANAKHLAIAKEGPEAIAKWWEEKGDLQLDMSGADFGGASLRYADFHHADLSGAWLSHADLHYADFSHANLSNADLFLADLFCTDFLYANLSGAYLSGTDLSELVSFFRADLSHADLSKANLRHGWMIDADLSNADLSDADLTDAWLRGAIFRVSNLRGATLSNAEMSRTVFSDTDISVAKGLESVSHDGPSTIGLDTLVRSKGKIPEEFLHGCGFAPWEILTAKLYDPSLAPDQVAALQQDIFKQRRSGSKVGAVLLSFSVSDDAAESDCAAANKIRDRLSVAGLYAWVDSHFAYSERLRYLNPKEANPTDVVKQIDPTGVVLLILSKNSVNREWVERELQIARQREKDGKRNLLYPIALDDSWKSKSEDINWECLGENNIVDFSDWEDDERFEEQFCKMLEGIRLRYEQ